MRRNIRNGVNAGFDPKSNEGGEREIMEKKKSRMKTVIIILSCLLVLSAGGLAARYIYLEHFAHRGSTVTIPDNLIGSTTAPTQGAADTLPPTTDPTTPITEPTATDPTSLATDPVSSATQDADPTQQTQPQRIATALELYKGNPGDNERFEVKNMFPGDLETKYFCVKVHHDADVTLTFRAKVTEQTKALADVLHIRVTRLDTGNVLLDAPFSQVDGKEISEVLKADSGETVCYYQIDVSLDTHVGNAYQAAMLKADFEWIVKDESGLTPPPQTGDNMNLALAMVAAVSSVLILLLLIKRGKEKDYEQ